MKNDAISKSEKEGIRNSGKYIHFKIWGGGVILLWWNADTLRLVMPDA